MGNYKKITILFIFVVAVILGGIYYLINVPISQTNNKGVDFRIGTKADIDFVAKNLKRRAWSEVIFLLSIILNLIISN
ncbi:hypothetical protein PL321_14730 [Caloramator sp. mosi_1]|uniref:hypothetical protein n=1 Tax=Caloramator sp. mosi_1 TaxID=3023090 RepID=UPI00235FB5CF|nr:hypothetical protein [Caloramator sp. mosi_1]WDC83768.1 hypothetical protein PL321_14730 [Caloramator sp. mosi_1]